jgi:hypothetical protein
MACELGDVGREADTGGGVYVGYTVYVGYGVVAGQAVGVLRPQPARTNKASRNPREASRSKQMRRSILLSRDRDTPTTGQPNGTSVPEVGHVSWAWFSAPCFADLRQEL